MICSVPNLRHYRLCLKRIANTRKNPQHNVGSSFQSRVVDYKLAETTGFGHLRVQDPLCSSPDRSRRTWVRFLHFLASASRDAVS